MVTLQLSKSSFRDCPIPWKNMIGFLIDEYGAGYIDDPDFLIERELLKFSAKLSEEHDAVVFDTKQDKLAYILIWS